MATNIVDVTEQKRLNEAREAQIPWKKWGPYLSERQWGTVREDYSENGDAWNYFTHDHARSRAYRWGEDGLGGLCDEKQRLCLALALWNERDPILKERLFGLTNSEGNHGEDVKEYYFYIDSTPTHSYMKYLYKYPQRAYPYSDLVETNRRRSREEFEYELLDTGVFEGNRYFDVFMEYAKESPEAKLGTKTAAHYLLEVPARGSKTVRLRLAAAQINDAFGGFEQIFKSRIADADEFYDRITPQSLDEDQRCVHRQALAGILWSKQFYYFDLEGWLREHKSHPLLESARHDVRNTDWFHMFNRDVISMPDKWEYPWYAAWDLAFHTVALSLVDFDFAKEQLLLMLRSLYFHPSGQIPAYEWNFSDVNPPVHAWATLWLYKYERTLGRADLRFLERSFQGLMLNFNWWVNRKDPAGRNVFAGGFLGLDNIGVFDRSAQLPTGGSLEQADGTAWMAFYCQCMLEMALILCEFDPMYEDVAFKFVEHFMWIAYAMDRRGEHHDEMWDEQDGFFYDLLRLPDGQAMRLKVRSLVGLLPLCASTVFESNAATKYPQLMEMIALFRKRHPELVSHVAPTEAGFIGYKERRLLSILNKKKLERVLAYLLDEKEFLGPHGIRSLSRYHLEHPFVFHVAGQEYKVRYLPGESNTGMFGGNSNWRGPVWMPVNALIVRALTNLYAFYGDEFKVQCPTGSGRYMTLFEVAREISRRLASTFLRDAKGRRPVYGGTAKFQADPHWRDLILFYEYFHGDNGAGLGASHQTGWTGSIAVLLDGFGRIEAKDLELELGRVVARSVRAQVGGERTGRV